MNGAVEDVAEEADDRKRESRWLRRMSDGGGGGPPMPMAEGRAPAEDAVVVTAFEPAVVVVAAGLLTGAAPGGASPEDQSGLPGAPRGLWPGSGTPGLGMPLGNPLGVVAVAAADDFSPKPSAKGWWGGG